MEELRLRAVDHANDFALSQQRASAVCHWINATKWTRVDSRPREFPNHGAIRPENVWFSRFADGLGEWHTREAPHG